MRILKCHRLPAAIGRAQELKRKAQRKFLQIVERVSFASEQNETRSRRSMRTSTTS